MLLELDHNSVAIKASARGAKFERRPTKVKLL
jgi:hypothetical protein